MSPHEIEKLVLGTCMAFPNGRENIPQRVSYELDLSRIGDPAHSYIFSAIKSCVAKKITPNPANVAMEMNGTLDKAGGLEYIESLPRFLSAIGVHDTSSIGDWVRRADLNGRSRLIHTIINKRISIPLDDFLIQVSKAEDPEKFLADIFKDINRYLTGSQTGYRPFSDAIEEFEERLKKAGRGEVTEIIPCGIPNLMKYCIPRPRSFGVLQGISGQGKTSFATYIAIGVADALRKRGERGKVSLNTFEQQGSRIAQRAACMFARVNSLNIAHGKLTRQEIDRLLEATEYLKALPIIYNDDPKLTSSQFVTHAIIENINEPRVLGISDYTELFQDTGDSEELRISGIVRNVRTVCWETGSCELLLSQVNDSALKNSYGIGGLFSSRYSRSLAHAADFFMEIVNYPQMRAAQLKPSVPDGKDENLAYTFIEKNKDYPMGEEPFEWVAEYTLFRDVSLPMGKLYADIQKEDDF